MTKEFVLALDQGTTSSRAILFDRAGRICGVEQQEFRQIYPQSGWVEHDPSEIWRSQLSVMRGVLEHNSIRPDQVAAVGITNQRETVVLWDRNTGAPVMNAIVWQDRRTAGFCDELKESGLEAEFQQKTGLKCDPYFSGTKIRWMLDHVPGVRERAEKGELAFGTVDSWLIWKLTGGKEHVSDVTNASRTLLFNIHTLEWDDELLRHMGVPRSLLPEVKESSAEFGKLDAAILPGELPIAGVAGDQQAALFGQACYTPGMAKNTYGTGCFLLMNLGKEAKASQNNLLTTIAWKIGGKVSYALEGSVFIAGALIQWLRDELRIIDKAEEINGLAAQVEDSGGVVVVPAFSGLGAPYWDPYARGTIIGITRGTSRAHIARAALESIALQSFDLVTAMESDAGMKLAELRVDGGAAQSDLLMQIQSDLLQTTVVRPQTLETTALGAAYLAGLTVGFWKDQEEIQKLWGVGGTFHPKRSLEQVAKQLRFWKRAVERSRGWEQWE